MNRRNFLLQAILFSGGGLIVGGTAAALANRFSGTAPTTASPAAVSVATAQAAQTQLLNVNSQVAQLQTSLKASQEALAQLQPKFQETLTKNAELQNTLSQKTIEVDKLRAQLTDAQTQLEKYKKLVALFDKLDNVKFDKLVVDGLVAASAGFVTVLAATPLVTAGLEIARLLATNFERDLTNFRASIDWLRGQIDSLNGSIGVVEAAIGQAMKTLDPVTNRMTQLVDYILANLPFGIGQSLRVTLKALNDLYIFLPPLSAGAYGQVVGLLTDPFSPSDKGLAQTLVKPLREKLFDPTEKLAAQFKTLNEIYLRDLHIPVRQATEDRAAVLREITDFRKTSSI